MGQGYKQAQGQQAAAAAQEVAPAMSAADSNQALLEVLEDDCITDPDGYCEIVLDDILYEGAGDEVEHLLTEVMVRSSRCGAALLADPTGRWDHIPEGANDLGVALHQKAALLVATADWTDDGEVEWDHGLEQEVWALKDDVERALDILDGLLLLLEPGNFPALVALLETLGKVALAELLTFKVRVEAGRARMALLVELFQKHQALYERYLGEASQDALGLFMGNVKSLEKLGKAISMAQAFAPLAKDADAYDQAKKMVGVDKTLAGQVADGLKEGGWKTAIKTIGDVVDLIEYSYDLGLTLGELEIMRQFVAEAREVQAVYAQDIAAWDANEAAFLQAIKVAGAFANLSVNVQRAVEDLEHKLDQAGEDLFRR